MKPEIFYWQWDDTPPRPDPHMTRNAAALLLRAWRRNTRRPAGHPEHLLLSMNGPGTYRATVPQGPSGTMYTKGKP